MSKSYQILAHVDSHDMHLDHTLYESVDYAVRSAIELFGSDFRIVQVINWRAEESDE